MHLACVLARALKFGGVHGYVYFLFFKQKVHIPFIFNFKSVLRHRPCIACKNNTSDPLPLLARGRAGECRAVKPTERRAIAKCLKKCVITQGILLQISLGLLHMRKKGRSCTSKPPRNAYIWLRVSTFCLTTKHRICNPFKAFLWLRKCMQASTYPRNVCTKTLGTTTNHCR